MTMNYMLDTNIVSFFIKNQSPFLRDKIKNTPLENISISVITKAELLHGLAKVPEATKLALAVNEFLIRVNVLDWDSDAAESYALLKSEMAKKGKNLGTLDILIAAHALSVSATLITNDKAFKYANKLINVEDWTK